jgi:hypothetical protein
MPPPMRTRPTPRTGLQVKTAARTGSVPVLRRQAVLEGAGGLLSGPGADAVIATW